MPQVAWTLKVVLIAEQGGQPLLLAVGEQVGAGVQGAAGAVKRGLGGERKHDRSR